MLAESQASEKDVQIVVPERLLITLHDWGTTMSQSDNVLYRQWGLHLLEDWRSLELLAQRQEGNAH